MSRANPHAPLQALALSAVLVGCLPAVLAAAVADPLPLAGAWFGLTVAGYLCAAGGAMVAAFSFVAGDAQRPGWLCLAGSWLVLVPARLVGGPVWSGLVDLPQRASLALAAASVGSGLLAVAGFVILTGAWRDSGLDQSSRRSRVVLRLLALAAAAALAGPDLVGRLPAALHGDAGALGDVITDLLDGALLVVAAPVLRAALALGGGLAAWPWAFLTAGLVAWLGYDAMAALGDLVGLAPRAVRLWEETFRALAAVGTFSAGVGQRWMMTELRRR